MKCLELFSGAGGLACGLSQAGFEHVALVEQNRHACYSLRQNFAAPQVHETDIRTFDFSTLPQIDLVAGGPPCQPFSLGGKHQANDDSRDMFPHAIRAIEQLTPKAFVFENVKGLLRASFSEYFEYILLRLSYPAAGHALNHNWRAHLDHLRQLQSLPYAGVQYRVQFQLLNAADFGVPQLRERVIIVGIRTDLGQDWAFPTPTHSEDRLLWDQYVTGTYWSRHGLPSTLRGNITPDLVRKLQTRYGMFEPDSLPWQTVRDALRGLPDPRSPHHLSDHLFRDGARSYPGHTGSEIDWPAKTIKAGAHGVPGGENMIRYRDDSIRYFTVLEAKRIQSFPDKFSIHGAWGEAMRQIGNAVPVRLAEIIGRSLWQTLLPTITPTLQQVASA